MVKSPSTENSPFWTWLTRPDLNEMSGYFSTSRKSALFKCASRWASRVSIDAASIEASTLEFATLDSSRFKTPATFAKCPFTLAIIMCLTLNSASACAGSMFQVVGCSDTVCVLSLKSSGNCGLRVVDDISFDRPRIDAQFLHAVKQGAAFDAQPESGAIRSADPPSGLAQDAHDSRLLFVVADYGSRIDGATDLFRQSDGEHVAGGENH